MFKWFESEKQELYLGYGLLVLLFVQLFTISLLPINYQTIFYNIIISLIYLSLVLFIKNNIWFVYVFALIVLEWLFVLFKLHFLAQLLFVFNVCFFIFIIFHFIVRIAHSKSVSAIVILNAINAYLLLAVLSAIIIKFIHSIDLGAIDFPQSETFINGVPQVSDFQYFGLVTLSTLGYGEIVPVSPIARSVSTLITIVGQLYIAIILAMLVGKFSSRQSNTN